MQGGTGYVALVGMPRNKQKELLDKKIIAVGWGSAKLYELIDPVRCLKCSEYDYTAKTCREGTRVGEAKCFRCGKVGKDKAKCYHCGGEDNKPSSMA